MSKQTVSRRVTAPSLRARKGGEKIVCLTAYTAPMAQLMDPHCDLLLVGDSLGMVVHGFPTTVGVTLDMMVLTLEYKINFLRPATGRLLVARGEVLRAGRSVIVTRVDVLDEEQRVCAAMQQTIVPAPSAKAST